MSAGSKVIVFQMCAPKSESQISTGAQSEVKLMSAGVLIRGNRYVLLNLKGLMCTNIWHAWYINIFDQSSVNLNCEVWV